jgi:hypothetical protein
VSNRVLPDRPTIRRPDRVFQSKALSTPIGLKRSTREVRTTKPNSLTKKGIMDTQRNPNEPSKPTGPGQQGGQKDRESEERERQRREREKQGGGQQRGGQQGGR